MEESGGDRLTHASLVIQSASDGGSQAGGRKKQKKENTREGRGRVRRSAEIRSDPFSGHSSVYLDQKR